MHVTVIGAGIGGLTTAIALRQRGIAVEVYERSAALGDVGAGIGLWANALKALHQLGLKAPLDARSFSSDEGALRTVAGAVLSRTSSHEIVARFGMPFTVFHRAELLEVLRDAARDIPIHLDHECVGVTQGPDGVSVGFAAAGGRRRTSSSARTDSVRQCARAWGFPARFATPATPRGAGSPLSGPPDCSPARRWDAASASGWSRSPATASIGTRPTTCPKEGVRSPNSAKVRLADMFSPLARAHSRAHRGHTGRGDPPQRHLRSRSGRSLGRGSRDVARRRGASDDAESRSGRLPGD